MPTTFKKVNKTDDIIFYSHMLSIVGLKYRRECLREEKKLHARVQVQIYSPIKYYFSIPVIYP